MGTQSYGRQLISNNAACFRQWEAGASLNCIAEMCFRLHFGAVVQCNAQGKQDNKCTETSLGLEAGSRKLSPQLALRLVPSKLRVVEKVAVHFKTLG